MIFWTTRVSLGCKRRVALRIFSSVFSPAQWVLRTFKTSGSQASDESFASLPSNQQILHQGRLDNRTPPQILKNLQRMVAWVDSALGIWRASAAIEGENGVKIVRIPMQRTRVPSCNMGIACLSPAFKHPPNQQDREASAPRKNARVLKAVPHGRASQNR